MADDPKPMAPNPPRGSNWSDGINDAPNEVMPLPSEEAPVAEPAENLGDFNVTGYDEIRWVFNNMDNPGVTKHEAPSPGAYGLLLTCSQDLVSRRNFYNNMWMPLTKTESVDIEKVAVARDADRVLAQLDKVAEISAQAMEG